MKKWMDGGEVRLGTSEDQDQGLIVKKDVKVKVEHTARAVE